jgi:hypothetical protein
MPFARSAGGEHAVLGGAQVSNPDLLTARPVKNPNHFVTVRGKGRMEIGGGVLSEAFRLAGNFALIGIARQAPDVEIAVSSWFLW